jgi:RHS repeat-associated protein
MSDQQPMRYDFDSLRGAAQSMKQFGGALQQMGLQFKQIHQQLTEHCSGDDSGIGGAIDDATSDSAEAAGGVFSEGGRVLGEMGSRSSANADRTESGDQAIADAFNGTSSDRSNGSNGSNGGAEQPGRPGGGSNGAADSPLSDTGGQQSSETDPDDLTSVTDPVDVVSGMMYKTETDVELPGLLPLVLSRTFRSNYRQGALFGRRWASTLDQRVETGPDGIHFAAEDGVILHYPPAPRGQSVLPAGGRRWPLRWDAQTDTITVTDPVLGHTRVFPPAPGPSRPLAEIADRNGHRIRILRDEFGRPSTVAHSGGYQIAVDLADTRVGLRISALRLLDGTRGGQGTELLAFGYDLRGNVVETVNSTGLPLVFEYDAEDRIVKWANRSGTEYVYEYDAAGRVVRTLGSDGFLSGTLEYDTAQRMTRAVDSLGAVREYHWDGFDRVIRQVDPLGRVTLSSWDRAGNLLSRTDPLDRTVSFTYDEAGNTLSAMRPDGTVLRAEYDEAGQPVRVIEPDGAQWRYEYDDCGNVLTVTDASGASTVFHYAPGGRLESHTDPLGNTTRVETNSAGLPVCVTDPLGAATQLRRDALGRVVEIVDPLGAATRLGWTVEGDPAWREEPGAEREEWRYSPGGDLIEYRDSGGQRSVYDATHFGRPISRTDPDGAQYEFTYDTELRLASVRNAHGDLWRYEYDAAGQLAGETDFNGAASRYEYDAAGRMIARTNGAGQRVELAYGADGLVAERRIGDDETHSYRYDAAGRLLAVQGEHSSIAYTRDLLGRTLSESVDGQTTGYEYDAAGQVVARTTPAGEVSRWTYDAASRPATLATTGGGLAFQRDAAGREVARLLGPQLALWREFDAAGRVTGEALWQSPADAASETAPQLLLQRAYSYRPDGYINEVFDRARGPRRYALDQVGRVTAVSGADWTESYAYDAAGNISAAQYPGGDEVAGEREHSGTLIRRAGRTSYEHDGQGRLVRARRRTLSGKVKEWLYTWDADSRLVRAVTPEGGTWQYAYDPLGRRVAKVRLDDAGRTVAHTRFTWDGTRLAEQTAVAPDGAVITLTWDWEPGGHRALTQLRRSRAADAPQSEIDAEFHAIITDQAGTPTELVSVDGTIAWQASASVWGAAPPGEAADAAQFPLGFPGQYRDAETGLSYNYYRYYDPATGTYLSPDPIGLLGGLHNLRYAPNPLTWSDPLGLRPGEGFCPVTGNLDEKTYNDISKAYGPKIAAGVQYNFKRLIADGATSHEIPGIGKDPEALAAYLDQYYGKTTHIDQQTGRPVAYDSSKGVIIVDSGGNYHAYVKSQQSFQDGEYNGAPRYVPKPPPAKP